jgi:hypothetical protein
MAHWVMILSAASGPFGLAAWRYAPRAFLMLVGGLTKDPQRSEQCERMLILQRKDAKEILNLTAAANAPSKHELSASKETAADGRLEGEDEPSARPPVAPKRRRRRGAGQSPNAPSGGSAD